jgi:hypothetical protein
MKMVLALILPAFTLMASCSSTHQPEVPDDVILRRNAQAGDLALSLDHPEEAIGKYQAALVRARARDDATAIGDYGYDLAVAQLVANQPRQALASIRTTRAELAHRGAASFAALDLAEATACYRIGEKEESDRIAAHVEAGVDPVAAARASFLRGLIADETNDSLELDAAIARLASGSTAPEQADTAELSARRDIRRGAFAAAIVEAERAVDLRRSDLDYRGMARALSVAADAASRAGNASEAAALYLRAGQSAAAQSDAESARSWLLRATELSSDPALRDAARLAIAELGKSTGTPRSN